MNVVHGASSSGASVFSVRPTCANMAAFECTDSETRGFAFKGDKGNVSVIGVGRLGLVTALCLEKAGYNVLGVDIFPDYCRQINDRSLKSAEPHVAEMLLKSRNFFATCDFDSAVDHSNIIFVLVDTPSTGGSRHYDVTKLGRVLTQLNDRMVENKDIVICCTVMPGYIRNIGRHILRNCTNCTVSYNPEFIAQGAIVKGFLNPDIVLIGEGSPEIGDKLEQIYRDVCDNQPAIERMSVDSAEICKISLNCFVTMKIAYANTIADIASRTPGADGNDILKAIGCDSRVGSKCLLPGWGFGGPCFPRDNRALAGYAESVGVQPLLARATDASNEAHAKLQVERYISEEKSRYIFETVTFKEPCAVPIIEESQKLVVAAALAKAGKTVIVIDRPEVLAAVRAEFGGIFQYEECS